MAMQMLDHPEVQETGIPDRQGIERALLSGKPFAGITLEIPAQRRLFRYLLDQPDLPSSPFPLPYLDGLKAAFLGDDATEGDGHEVLGVSAMDAADKATKVQWLSRIETRSFGGLNALNGEPFILNISREGVCVEGYNGRGKTSLVSAIVWALTGHRLIPQAGPVKDVNDAHPLYEPAVPEGQLKDTRLKVARRWPPVIAYPWSTPSEDITAVKGRAEVILTFTDDAGNTTELHRSLSEDGVMEEPDFTALGVPDIAVEIAVMMPNRIPFIGVNTSENEIAALVKLLGLEPLGRLADHVSALIHGNSTFMRSPSAKDITDAERRFQEHVGRADEALRGLSIHIAPKAALSATVRHEREAQARQFAQELAGQAAKMLQAVAGIIADAIDLSVEGNRKSVAGAIARLHGCFDGDRLPEVPLVILFEALRQAEESEQLARIRQILVEVRDKFGRAQVIRERQLADHALRLKAVAARFHHETHGESVPVTHCPLCRKPLSDADGQALAHELEQLREEAVLVEKTFSECCRELSDELVASIPETIRKHRGTDPGADPARSVAEALRRVLEDNMDLGIVAQKARTTAVRRLTSALADLPTCNSHQARTLDGPPLVGEDDRLRKALDRAGWLLIWAEWWSAAKPAVAAAWKAAMGTADEPKTLLGACAAVDDAVDRAKPFETAAKALEDAATAAKRHDDLGRERDLKDAIKEALLPLRELRTYVNQEAEAALASVSDRAATIFESVYDGRMLVAPEAVAGQRGQTQFIGAFGHGGHRVDARYLANTSWLRAFLWSFYLAFRERAIQRFGGIPLPLLLADDPQVSFDSAHAKRWVQHFRGMAQVGLAQFIITSHDENFLKCLRLNNFPARPIMVLGLNLNSTKPNLIFDGDALKRCWEEFQGAKTSNCDVERHAQNYIKALREHVEAVCEGLLRNAGVRVTDTTVGGLLKEFKKADIPESLRLGGVQEFADELENQSVFRRTMNEAHHEAGLRQLDSKDAELVHQVWQHALESRLFVACREVELHQAGNGTVARGALGPPAKVIPLRGKDHFLARPLLFAGRVAALTGGRVVIEAPEVEQKPRKLAPFGAVMATTDSLAPLVRAGDTILVHMVKRPADGDLVVAAAGDRLLLGRLHEDSPQAPVVSLAAMSQTVDRPVAPVRFPRGSAELKAVTGVIWRSRIALGALGVADDIAELDSDDAIGLPADAYLFEVDGVSAEPRALDGHSVIAGAWVDGMGMLDLEGRIVIAACEGEDDTEQFYLKRVHFDGETAWLVNINPDHNSLPVRVCCSLTFLPRLKRLAPVIGVLFDRRKC